MKAERRSWAFEFKQWTGTTPASKRLTSYMSQAKHCAGQIREGDADRSVAGLIIPLYHIRESAKGSEAANRQRSAQQIAEYATSCDYVWQIKPIDDNPSTYFLFKIVNRWT